MTPLEYLAALPEDRRRIVSTVRDVIRAHLADGLLEAMVGGAISYHVPIDEHVTAGGAPLQAAAIVSLPDHVALHLPGTCARPDGSQWLRDEWTATGKVVDLDGCSMRFRRLEDIPRLVIGDAITQLEPARLIADLGGTQSSAAG
jgi:hypothetical protein